MERVQNQSQMKNLLEAFVQHEFSKNKKERDKILIKISLQIKSFNLTQRYKYL